MRRMKGSLPLRCAALLLAVTAGCAHAPPPAPSAPPGSVYTAAQQQALAGTWVYTADPVETAALELSIERSVSGLFSLAQGVAAESLRARTTPRPQLTLEFQGSAVRITSPGEFPESGTLDGPAVLLTNRFGDQTQTTFRIEDGNLITRGISDGGSGETVFASGADGQMLRLTRRVASDQLSAPLEVTFSYRRQH